MAVVTAALTLKAMGSALLKSLAKKATMATVKKAVKGKAKDFVVDKAKDKIKSKFKKKKVKGKDIARKMLGGGEEGGGTTFGSMGGPIVPSPAGQLVPTGEVSIVKAQPGSKEASELGLIPFMTSLDTVKESVDKINESLNNNLKDAKKRVEKQRLLNAREKKKSREAALESTMVGRILKRPVDAAKDAADNFLMKLLKFFLFTTLGVLINALMGGVRDIIRIFVLGIKGITMAWPTIKRFFKNITASTGNVFKSIASSLGRIASSVVNVFKKVGSTIFNWIKNAIKTVGKAIWNFLKNPLKWAVKAVQKGVKHLTKPVRNFLQRHNPLKKGSRLRNLGSRLNPFKKGSRLRNLGSRLNPFKKGSSLRNLGSRIRNINLKDSGKNLLNRGGNLLKRGRQFISKTVTGAVQGVRQWADNALKSVLNNPLVKNVMSKANQWRKQFTEIAELVAKKQWNKLIEKGKNFLLKRVKPIIDKNPIFKRIKDLAKNPKRIGGVIEKFGKSKGTKQAVKVLRKAKALKITGVDAVLTAILAIVDYKMGGEAPINALLNALGNLLGFTAGAALGAPTGGLASFALGAAGGWAGEQAAKGLTAVIANLPTPDGRKLGDIEDPIAKDGRKIVRNQFANEKEGLQAEKAQQYGEGQSYAETEAQQKKALGDKNVKDNASEISSSTSYEDGEGASTIIINQGSESPAVSGGGKGGKPGFIKLPVDDLTIVNSQYEMLLKSKTFKS